MPRKELDIDCRVEHLSLLDENGEVDKDLEPDLQPDFLLKLYRAMVLGRKFDERMYTMQRQGRIGTFAPTKGQEASSVGAAAALGPDDWMVPSFREAPGQLYRGARMENILLVYGGFNEGLSIPKEAHDLPVSIPVGTHMLHATGLAYAMRYRKKNTVAMTFFGDGATSEGDFHEAMNFAAVFQLPVVFVCQNNHWAISVPRSRQTHSKTLAQKGVAYGVPGLQVDGNDVLAVYSAAREAVDRARSGGGPTLIECVTYRLSVHTTADDPKKYRQEEEVAKWLPRDPITRFQKYLVSKGVLSDEKVGAMDEEIKAAIKEAEAVWMEKSEAPVDSLTMFDDFYDELPPGLLEQKRELEKELEAKRAEQK